MKGFANISHVQKLQDFFIPKFESFGARIDEFLQDNEKVRECIIRFDKTICDKAQKSELLTMREKLEKSFISLSYADGIEAKIDSVINSI